MKIGIIGDSHDNIKKLDEAINFLKEIDIDMLLHTGDFISPFTIPHLKPFGEHLIGVYGNNDGWKHILSKKVKEIGGVLNAESFILKPKGVPIFLTHGHRDLLLDSAINSGLFHIVIYGHTHKREVRKENGTLIINPGELCGYLTGNSTLAILDLNTMEVLFHTL